VVCVCGCNPKRFAYVGCGTAGHDRDIAAAMAVTP